MTPLRHLWTQKRHLIAPLKHRLLVSRRHFEIEMALILGTLWQLIAVFVFMDSRRVNVLLCLLLLHEHVFNVFRLHGDEVVDRRFFWFVKLAMRKVGEILGAFALIMGFFAL